MRHWLGARSSWWLLAAAGQARAQDGCAALQEPGAVGGGDRRPGRPGRDPVGAARRLRRGRAPLRDGVIGAVTLSFLAKLCEQVPLAAGTDPVAGTLDLAREYAAVTAGERPTGPAGVSRLPAPGAGARGRLRPHRAAAGRAARDRGAALGGAAAADGAGCGDARDRRARPRRGGLARCRRGWRRCSRPTRGCRRSTRRWPRPRRAGDPGGAGPGLRRLSLGPAGGAGGRDRAVGPARRRRARTPLTDLGSPGLRRLAGRATGWCGWARLLGSVPAVVRLLADYRAEPRAGGGGRGARLHRRPTTRRVPTYFALDAADLERLAARSALARGAGAGRGRALRRSRPAWSTR